MSTDVNFQLYVTNIDSEGPFLKLTGQIAKNRALTIEEIIRTNKDALEKGSGMVKPSSLSVGQLCIAQYQDGGFYRAKITNVTNIVKGYVSVNFIDYGNNEVVTVNSIRVIPEELMRIQPQASDFLLSRIIHKEGRWSGEALLIVSQLVRYKEMPCVVELHSCNLDFIRCHLDQCPVPDLSSYLTDNGIGIPVTTQHQECLLQELRAKINAYNPYHAQNQVLLTRPPLNTVGGMPSMGVVPNAAYPQSDFSKPTYIMSASPESVDMGSIIRHKAHRNILPPRPLNRNVGEHSPSRLPGFKPSSSSDRIISSKSPSPVKTSKKSNPSTYKSRLLALNSRHDINISFAKDGPELFAIQLKSDESALGAMIQQINQLTPESLSEPPMIGSVCLGRFSDDNSLRRAVVMGLTGTQCKLFFVDFGMTDLVSYYDIFYIPEELVIPCVFSLRFCLSGIKNLEITEDIKKFFYEIVTGKVVTLVVVAPEGPPLIQYGELFLNGRSVKDILIQKRDPKLLSFQSIPPASIVGEHSVLVSFVDSCTKFFVQLSQNIDDMTEVMNDVADHCSTATPLSFHEVTCGLVCCALFPDDQSWYRAQVISIKKEKITVKYVDYGNEQEVTADLLRPLNLNLIKLKSQGIHCALKGYENKPFDQSTTNYLETLTLEKILRIKVCKLLNGDILLVELYDDSCNPPVNIAEEIVKLCRSENHTVKEKKIEPFIPVESERVNFDKSPSDFPQHADHKKRPEKNYYDRKNHGPPNERTNNYGNDSDTKRFNKYDKPQNYNKSEGGSYSQDRRYNNRQENSLGEGRNRDKNKGQKKIESRDRYNDKKGDVNKSSQSKDSYVRHNQREKGPRFGRGDRNQNIESDSRQYREPFKGKNKKYAGSNSGSDVNSEIDTDSSKSKSYGISKSLKDPMPLNTPFEKYHFSAQAEEQVNVSWFINPNNFYVQILTQKDEFQNMMLDIPNLYKDIKSMWGNEINAGSSVLARFPEDSVLYRAEVLKIEAGKYLVHFVDFGNKCLVDGKDIWQLDRELMTLPKMAVKCSLSDIMPADKEWMKNPDVNNHFSALSYTCVFKSVDSDDVYSVSLLCSDGTDVKDTLIQKNLAIGSQSPSQPGGLDEPVELPMLVSQYFSAYVKNVESISKIYIQLNSYRDTPRLALYDQTLECMLNNCEAGKSAQLVKHDQLILLLKEKNFIIHVNGVVDERLKITIYNDETFERVNLFTSDDTSCERVPMVCPHPVYNKFFGNAFISHIESPSEIYLQREVDTDIISELLDALFNYYEVNEEPPTSLGIGTFCAAQSDDGNWYRSKILKSESDKCLVRFIDYGNQSSVSTDKVRALISDFHDIPQLCQPVALAVPIDDITFHKFETLTADKKLNVILTKGERILKANIFIDGMDIVESLFEKQLPSQQETAPVSTSSVIISHIDSPGQFWLQLVSELDKINNLQADLQMSASLEDLPDRDVGKLCIAKYSGDDQFYRAVILDADSDIATVRFIDYGNTDVLDNSPSNLKCLSTDLESIPPYATKCSVNATPTGTGQWTEQAAEEFIRLLRNLDDAVEADFVLKDVTAYVDIYVDGRNITKQLVEAGFANPAETSDDGKMATCFASHVSSPSEFWIQLESSIHDLEAISERLVDAANFAPVGDIEEEVICAAKFPEDGQWYRAQVIINGTDGTEVLFMDYGNAALTDELRSLPDSLKMLPALSRKCALQKPSNIKNWSKEAEIAFAEMAADGATIFHVVFIASGDISIVDLFVDGRSVTNELVSLCDIHLDLSPSRLPLVGEDMLSLVKISHCKCPEDFWVQAKSSAEQLELIEMALKDAERWEVSKDIAEGALCVSLFPEDGLWYRSKVLDLGDGGTEVQYIDYGNTSVTDEVRIMPSNLIEIPPLASHCSLLTLGNNSIGEQFHEKFAELASESCEMRMEIIDSASIPMTVKLYLNDEDITKQFSNVFLCEEDVEQALEPAWKSKFMMDDQMENFDNGEKDSCHQEALEIQEECLQKNVSEDIDPIVEQKTKDLNLETIDMSSKVSYNITSVGSVVVSDVSVNVNEQLGDSKEDIHGDIANISNEIEDVINIINEEIESSCQIDFDASNDTVEDKFEEIIENLSIANDSNIDKRNVIEGVDDSVNKNNENEENMPNLDCDKVDEIKDSIKDEDSNVNTVISNKKEGEISEGNIEDQSATNNMKINETIAAKNGSNELESESSDKDYEDVHEDIGNDKTKVEKANTHPQEESEMVKEETAESTAVDTTTTEDEHDDSKCNTKKTATSQKKKASKGKKKAK